MRTMVFGASPNPYRFSNAVTLRLQESGLEVIPAGIKEGRIGGQDIIDITDKPYFQDVHTISMYLNPGNQKMWFQYLVELNPQRIIFNPGSENPELYRILEENDIEYLEACTLVMLASNSYIA